MKYAHIFLAREPWKRLVQLRMPIRIASKLLKYLKVLQVEEEVLEKQRVDMLRELTGIREGDIRIEPNTVQFDVANSRFSTLLDADCDLKPLDLKMADLEAALDAEQGNVLSVQDLANLEPFFTED